MQPYFRTHTLRILIASMAVIAIVLTASIILLLYRAMYQETLLEMGQGAQRFSNLLEAVMKHDAGRTPNPSKATWGTTLRQLEAGILQHYESLEGRELIIGRREGQDLLLFRAQPQQGIKQVARVPFDGKLARPMYLALQGKTGSGELPDYAGTSVLAGYAPVPSLDIGVVYKMDKAAMLAPFLRASGWAGGIALVLIALGAWIFHRTAAPLLQRGQKSQQRYTNFVNNARVAVFETDAAGRCSFVNRYWHVLTGLTLEQSLGEGWMQALHAEDRERLRSAWQAFVHAQDVFNEQFRLLHVNGSIRWVYAQASALRDAQGQLIGFSGTVTDISDTISARAALQDSEAHLREAQRLAQIGSWELDLVSNKLLWSDEIYRIFDIDQRHFGASYEAFLNAIHPEDREWVNQAYTASVADHTPYEIDHRLQMPDGRIKWVKERCATFYDASGKALRSAGTVQDITELKKTQLALERHQNHLEELVAQRTALLEEAQRIARLGHWSLDLASGALLWSDEIYRIFGHKPQAFAPSQADFYANVHAEDVALVRAAEQQAYDMGQPLSIDHRVVLPNGEIRWVHEDAVVHRDEQGNPRTLAGTVQDITARKMAEESLRLAKDQAERANRAKSEFLSHMSHELRTPMNAILGFAQVLETEPLQPEQLDFASEIHRAGRHLLQLIDELLDLSRIESGRMNMVLQPVDIQGILHDALQITHNLLTDNNMRCHNRCQTQYRVLADETRLKQILVNLLTNAAKYGHSNGAVTLDCTRHEDSLRISIHDDGPGIPPEKLPLLFKPFERLGAEQSGVDGTGIGLALSKQLAELMGGHMGCDSSPGQGATFWIELPRAPAHPAPATTPPLAPGADAHFKVLYIEDNAANLKVVEAIFKQQANLQLISATNGEYGLELARRYVPDAILLDIHLPGLDGYGVLEALLADPATARIPVIALSADAMPIDIESGLQAGFLHYLTKPIKIEVLLNTLHGIAAWQEKMQDVRSK